MFNYVHSIKFGRFGVVLDWGGQELLIRNEVIDTLTSMRRTGCRIDWYNTKSEKDGYWHFKHLQDAIDFMEWAMGVEAPSG